MIQQLQEIFTISWVQLILFYLVYLIVVAILYYGLKGILKAKIKKSRTKLDDKIIEGSKRYGQMFILLFGISLIAYFRQVEFYKDKLVFSILTALEILIVFLILLRITSILKKYFVKKFKKTQSEKLGLVNLIVIFTKIILICIGGLLILNTLGINITPLLASAGIVGFAVAMGSQEIIKNFISGMIVLVEKPFNIGDKIGLSDGTTLFVEEIGIRTSKFRTVDGNLLMIPNGELLSMRVENKVTRSVPTRKVQMIIGLPYGVDTKKAKKLLEEIMKDDERVLDDSITVILDSLGDWSVNFKAIGQVNIDDYDRKISSELTEEAYKIFNKEGIGFPFPTYTIEKVK